MNDIPQDAILTRFIFSSKHFARGNQTVKFRVFMPPQVSKEPPTYSPNLSVYRISEISDSEVWEIGQEHVQTEGRLIKARTDILAGDVYKNNLRVVPDTQPHERHANITPFPADKLTCQRIATKLAHVSKLVVIPEKT